MIKGKTVLGVISARGGSKGVPRKNLRNLGGKPLLAWTIEAAENARYLDRFVLSSEDRGIIEAAKKLGVEVPFVRPRELSLDNIPATEIVLHALKELPGYDYVVLLQPTSPLRLGEDIDKCIEKCARQNAGTCVSVTRPDKSPYWMFTLDQNDRMLPVMDPEYLKGQQRQDLPEVYVLNGAVYVTEGSLFLRRKSFLDSDTVAYAMPEDRSIDIDSEYDFQIAESLLSYRKYSFNAV